MARSQMTRTVLMASLLLATNCSSASKEAEKHSLQQEWQACVLRNIDRFDDGTSDPVIIANRVAAQCVAIHDRLIQTISDETSGDVARANFRDQMNDGEMMLITSALLVHRSLNRN